MSSLITLTSPHQLPQPSGWHVDPPLEKPPLSPSPFEQSSLCVSSSLFHSQPTQLLLAFVHSSPDLHGSQLVGVTLTLPIRNERCVLPSPSSRAHVGPACQFVIMEVHVVAGMRGILKDYFIHILHPLNPPASRGDEVGSIAEQRETSRWGQPLHTVTHLTYMFMVHVCWRKLWWEYRLHH